MAKKPAKPKIITTDRATQYALDVSNGRIIAGPYVRAACQRHINDLSHGPDRGLYWDKVAAERAMGFFEDELHLNGGKFEGKPFLLLPWQAFVISSLFGWKQKDKDGPRRFQLAYIEQAKGSGKSPLAAGVGLYGLVADGESRAEIYAAATTRDQAAILFRDALAMVDHSPGLNERLVASGTGDRRWNLSYPAKGSFFRIVSSDNKKSGLRPHICLLDEVHEAPNNEIIEMLHLGFKSRRQPMSFMITNSGCDMNSVCREYHNLGVEIVNNVKENDEFFAFICSLDDGDIENDKFLKDESVWPKCNPSLEYGLPGYDYIRKQIRMAEGLPGKMSKVKRLCFNIWVNAENPWIMPDVWFGCQDDDWPPEEIFYGRKCWGGLDLSSTQDLTAFVKLFEPIEDDQVWRLVVNFWLPGDNLKLKSEQDRVPYLMWRDSGCLEALPGRAINKLAVLKQISGDCELYDIQGIAYDRWRIEDLKMLADQEGIDIVIGEKNPKTDQWEFKGQGIKMVPYGQGFKDMAPAVDKFETMLLEKQIRHSGNPCLTWNAANAVVVQDPAGNRKAAKDKSTGRIDGIVSAVMCVGILAASDTESIFDQRVNRGEPVLRTF